MNSLIGKLIRNRNFQDLAGVARGIFKVIDASLKNNIPTTHIR
jgi:hypothetical protein